MIHACSDRPEPKEHATIFSVLLSFTAVTAFLVAMGVPAASSPPDDDFPTFRQPLGEDTGPVDGGIAWGDADGDGDLDLAVTGQFTAEYLPNPNGNYEPSRFVILEQHADGSFSVMDEPMGEDKGVFSSSVEWSDLDRDGDLELVVSGVDDGGSHRFMVFENDGSGNFSLEAEPMLADPNESDTGLRDGSFALADYDGDGDTDLAATGFCCEGSSGNHRFILFENDGNGNLSIDAEPKGTDQGFKGGEVDWADIDGDGDPDLAVHGQVDLGTTREFHIYENDGFGNLTRVQEPMGWDAIAGGLQFADIDGDGDPDLAASGKHSDGTPDLVVLENDGSGQFTVVQRPMDNGGFRRTALEWGDFDGDGDPDLVVQGDTNSGSDKLTHLQLHVYENDGTGELTLRNEPLGNDTGLVSANQDGLAQDFDQDGTIEVAAGGSDNNDNARLIIFENSIFQSCIEDDIDQGKENDCENESVVSDTRVEDTGPNVDPPPRTRTAFHQIILENNPDTTSGDLRQAALDGEPSPDVRLTIPLLAKGRDTAEVSIWTDQPEHSQLVNLRSDTESLHGPGLPEGIPDSKLGRTALGRTALMLEFLDATQDIIGDSATTTHVGDSFAYTLEYRLSEATTRMFNELGFDTAPGSGDFGFYYADRYGDTWVEDTGVDVSVQGRAGGGISVKVAGITKDLPGGLGAAQTDATSSSGSSSGGGSCLIERTAPKAGTASIRKIRDSLLLENAPGRAMTRTYYQWF